jgi:hypothetical protein
MQEREAPVRPLNKDVQDNMIDEENSTKTPVSNKS